MKKSFAIFCFFIMSKTYSYDGIILTLEAPLLKEASLDSVVLQTLRKGSRVFVPSEIANLSVLPDFIQTYDRVGNIAYIPTKYIKIVTNDSREAQTPIAYPKSDPTDYRLEEPIPETYPFDNGLYNRASLSLSSGNNMKAPFDYNSAFSKQNYSSEYGGRLSVTRKIIFDKYDRYYFGLFGSISSSTNKIQFTNGNLSDENRSAIRIGPMITYDSFKNSRYKLTLGTGFTFNYHKSTLKMSNANYSESRLFSGYSFSPIINSVVQVIDVFPNTDLITGADFSLFLPHSQKSSAAINYPGLWGAQTSNQFKVSLRPQVSFFFGVQVKY